MKTSHTIVLTAAALATGLLLARLFAPDSPPATPALSPQLTLSQILSIKELHLVRHTYHDLFFLHRHNHPEKALRAIVQVPVEVTAYINLREVELLFRNDSLKEIRLPRAHLNAPHYYIERMAVRETRGFQVHVGRDLYPQVGRYLQTAIVARMDSLRISAIAHRILDQAETEGKAYVVELLHGMGRPDVKVVFADEVLAAEAATAPASAAAVAGSMPLGYLVF